MSEVTMIGIDLAKRVFQPHGACANESGNLTYNMPAKRMISGLVFK
jgi:hypothetical protein